MNRYLQEPTVRENWSLLARPPRAQTAPPFAPAPLAPSPEEPAEERLIPEVPKRVAEEIVVDVVDDPRKMPVNAMLKEAFANALAATEELVREKALNAAENRARDWCDANKVALSRTEIRSLLRGSNYFQAVFAQEPEEELSNAKVLEVYGIYSSSK